MTAALTVYPFRATPMLLQFLAYIGGPPISIVETRDAVNCGRPLMRNSRIVGGQEAFPGEFPWMVSIHYRNQHYCGGALIANKWVLTASHCFHRLKNNTKSLSVIVGMNFLSSSDDIETAERFAVNKIITHPQFKTHNYVNDIALIQLNRPVTWSSFKLPVCLPDGDGDEKMYIGKMATVTGWGWTSEVAKGNGKPDALQKLDVEVIDNRKCSKWYSLANYPLALEPVQMCAGYKEGGMDSCEGDSGGPLVIRSGESYRIIGIVSSGLGCARPFLPGLYARVSPFVPWIRKYVGT